MTDQKNALLVTVADPFNAFRSRKLSRVEIGRTIFEVLAEQDYISMTETGVKRHGYFFVTLNGNAVMQADWNTVIREEDCLGVWALPQGGGGGSNIGVILITVVMVAAAVFTGGATLGVALAWGAAAGAAVGLLSSMVPSPATPSSGSNLGKDTASSTYTISAQGNTVRIGEAIPVQYGKMRVWPDLAAQPYTEIRGNVQYLYQLMVLGQGNFDVETIQIEESNINAYGDIEYEIIRPGQPVTLFPDNVITSQAVQGLELLAPDEEGFALLGPYVVSAPGVKTSSIAIDVQLPQGAYRVDDGGNNQPRSVQIAFWAQEINDAGVPSGPRTQIVNETLTFSTKTPQMLSWKVGTAEGRWQVDGQRVTLKAPDNRTVDKVIWSGLKGYAKSARTFGNVTMLATIIKATNNLNSNTSRRINTIQTRMLPTWDPVNGWKAEVATSNPAWAYADALRNSDYGPGWGTNRINMAELYRLSQIWAARKDEFNGIYDTRGTLWQALTQIAMVGRATPQYYAGVMDVIRDEPKTIPAQLFSPGQILQNTFKGSYKLGTSQTPDHVIVKFWNRETWQEDEVTCVLPGSTTKVPYTKDMTCGITDRDHAWREGMYAAAVNRDQRSRNSFTTEMEGLLLRFGDLIHVTHDVPGWGYPGKVISFNPTTGKIVTTEPLVFTAGATHYITFRRKNGKADGPWQIIADPNPTAGVNSALVQGTVANRQQIWISNGVTSDLTTYAFGPANRESAKLVVLSAKPNANGETQLTVCDYVTSTHIADQGGDVPPPGSISNLPAAPVGPIVNRVTVEMTTTVGEQQIVADPANGATYYEFEGMPQGGGNWTAFGVSGDPFLFVNLDAGPWIIRVRGVGLIPGPWATWTGTIALTSLPLPRLSKLTAIGKIFAIDLAVDYAEETRSIAKTLEIWAGRTNVLGNATLLVKLPYPATAYTHSVSRGADQWYYFARVIDSAGRVGPWFNNGAAVAGMSSMDADPILDQIAGEVTKDILGQELQKEIELITAPATIIGSVNNRVEQVRTDLNNQVQDLSTAIAQTNAAVNAVKVDVAGLKTDVTKLNGDVANINTQITTIAKAGVYQSNLTYTTGKSVRGSDDHLYTAIKAVPINTPPPNANYWLDVGQVAINENGSAAKITALTTRVSNVEGVQTSQATLINGLRTDVNGKASQVAFDALKSDVTTMGNTVTAQGQAITALTTEVNGKASAAAVNALTTRVSTAETNITTMGQSITNIDLALGQSGGQNMLYNPSFVAVHPTDARVPDGYAIDGNVTNTSSMVQSWLNSGERAFRASVTGITYTSPYLSLVTVSAKRPTVAEGQTITSSIYARRTADSAALSMRIYHQWFSASNTVISAPASALIPITTDGNRITYTSVAPAGAARVNIFFRVHGAVAAPTDGTFELARAQLEYGSRATGWRDSGQVLESGLAANVTATNALTGRIEQTEQGLTAQAQSITNLSTSLSTTNQNVTAAQNAANAANTLAGGKGKVIYGSTAPAVDDRLEQNIWIDTAGGNNTPKRWTGTAWVAVTDKVATDAANAAASALSQVATKAEATAVSSLTNRVTAVEGTVTSNSADITILKNSIGVAQSFVAGKAWEFTGTTEGWYAAAGGTISAGPLFATTVDLPNLQCNFSPSFPGAENPYLRIRLRRRNTSRSGAQMYWANEDGGLAEARRMPFSININTTDWQDIEVDLSQHAQWVGKRMIAIRLDMMTSGVPGEMDIAYIAVGRRSVAASAEAVSDLSTAVTEAQGQITSQGQAITSLRNDLTTTNNALTTKADASAVTNLTTRVSTVEGNQTSQGQAITNISTSLAVLGSQNLLDNPSFDAGAGVLATNWRWSVAGGATAVASQVASSLDAYGKAQRVTISGLTAGSGSMFVDLAPANNVRPTVIPGQVVTASVYARGTTGLYYMMYLLFKNAAGATISTTLAFQGTLADAWNRISGTTPAAPSDAATVDVLMRVRSGPGSTLTSGYVDWDRAQVEDGATLSGWRDNATVASAQTTANAGAITALTGRVSTVEGGLTSASQQITQLNNSVGTLTSDLSATSTAVQNLDSKVTQQGTNITAVTNRTTALENSVNSTSSGLATKASTASVTAIGNRVTATENAITAQSTSITALEARVGGIAPFVAGKIWEFVNSTQGWVATNSGGTITAGPLFATVANNPNLQCNFTPAIAGASNPYLRIRLRRRNTTRSGAQMYWANEDGGLAEARRMPFAIDITTTDWQDLEIDLSGHAQWNGKNIIAIRLDIMSSADTSGQIDIAYISAGRRSAAASAQALTETAATVTQIDGKLTAQVTRIDTLFTAVDASTVAIQDERTARINADGALGQRIDTTQSNINGVSASVQVISNAQTTLQNQANASYAVKLGVTSNGIYYASGFGTSLVNNQGVIQSTFAVLTDRFVVLNTTNNTLVSPFAIQNGQVFINDALISKLSVQNAIVGSTISSSIFTQFGEPLMTVNFNSGEIILRNFSRRLTYTKINNDGIDVVVDGVRRVRMGVW